MKKSEKLKEKLTRYEEVLKRISSVRVDGLDAHRDSIVLGRVIKEVNLALNQKGINVFIK